MYVNQYIKFYVLLESGKYEKQATIITTMPRIVEPAKHMRCYDFEFFGSQFLAPSREE